MTTNKPAPTSPGSKLLARREVAARLSVCSQTIKRYSKRGLLPVVIINSRVVRYRPEDVEALISNADAAFKRQTKGKDSE
jgi:predicted site-specific integrase-resolvase